MDIRLGVIVGSTREGRFARTVADWFVSRVALKPGLLIDLIDLADVNLPADLLEKHDEATERYLRRIGDADAFVLITPEYNHSYPACLKQAVDVAQVEWRAKPVAFVSYGGTGGGIRSVEHLRAVLPEVHATSIRRTISLHNVWDLFDEHGSIVEPVRYNESIEKMLDQLMWWARALRSAKRDARYVD